MRSTLELPSLKLFCMLASLVVEIILERRLDVLPDPSATCWKFLLLDSEILNLALLTFEPIPGPGCKWCRNSLVSEILGSGHFNIHFHIISQFDDFFWYLFLKKNFDAKANSIETSTYLCKCCQFSQISTLFLSLKLVLMMKRHNSIS